jgi:CspA family cold shock protein
VEYGTPAQSGILTDRVKSRRSRTDPEPTFEPLVHRILVHQSYNDNQLLAFGRNTAQTVSAIFVLACLSATCPFSGHSFQVIHNTQIVRFRARFVRGILLWRPKMAIGTVKFFDSGKGFGFIQPESGDKDVFVHVSAVQSAGMDTLTDGQRVSYDVVTERGKLAASNLKAA